MTLTASSIASPSPKWILEGGETVSRLRPRTMGNGQREYGMEVEGGTPTDACRMRRKRLVVRDSAGKGSGCGCHAGVGAESEIVEHGGRPDHRGCRAGSGSKGTRRAGLFAPCSSNVSRSRF